MRDIDDLALCIAVHQQIGFCIEQYGATNFFRPIVEVGDTAQTRLDTADDDGRIRKCLARALCVDDDGAVGSLATLAAGCVRVVGPQTAIARVAIDHRIHVSRGDAEEQIRSSERRERYGRLPIGLRDDADAEALRFEQATDDRHAETRVVDVRVAGHQDHVATIPTQRIHFGTRHGQKRCDTEACRPVLAMAEDVAARFHSRITPELYAGSI